MGIVNFFVRAAELASLDQAEQPLAGRVSYHKRIVLISSIFGAVGGVMGVGLAFVVATGRGVGGNPKILLAPFMLGAVGLLFGVALACLFAPREFLAGPVGQRWMKLIGTKSVVAARIVCGVFGLIVTAPFLGVALLLVFDK